jgi:CRISPR/Cas system CSM-associated protein Csm3 (group 7 of RAMP superfamily)
MNMILTYNINMLGYWHCGSGLSAGAEADSGVIKDADGLPFVPGKTIKGLLREAAMEMLNCHAIDDNLMKSVFGYTASKESEHSQKKETRTYPGNAHFSNAEIPDPERKEVKGTLAPYLYDIIASTSIDRDTGTAMSQTLRSIEVAVPVVLTGQIECTTKAEQELLKDCMKWVKALGAHRNRGLGRCKFMIKRN